MNTEYSAEKNLFNTSLLELHMVTLLDDLKEAPDQKSSISAIIQIRKAVNKHEALMLEAQEAEGEFYNDEHIVFIEDYIDKLKAIVKTHKFISDQPSSLEYTKPISYKD